MENEFFETIRVVQGKPLHLKYHQERYEKTLKALGSSEFESLASYIKAPSKELLRCKIIYDDKEILTVEYFPYKKRKINSLKILYADYDYALKATDRVQIDTLYKKREKCDDVLIVKNGYITDTSIANIALYKDNVWYTPKDVLLAGTTRQRYLDEHKLVLKNIPVDELDSFSQVALLNAMIDFDIIPFTKGDFFVK